MMKIESQRESICFDFGKDEQKQNFFDKAKKCDIIHNNNSVFLHKILSVKNQSLLEYTIKKNQSEILKKLNSSSEIKKPNNERFSKRTLHRTKTATFNENTLNSLLNEITINSPQNATISKTNILSPQINSPKIIVNKNKNLGNLSQKEKEKEKTKDNENYEKINLNTYSKENTFNKSSKLKREKTDLRDEFFINPEINFSNLYTCKYLRKPVVIKFNNAINPININNAISNTYNNNTAKKINFSMTSNEKEEKKESNFHKERIKTDERIKPYNFYEKSKIKPELYRSYEDLEKKSMEISRRRMKKNSSSKFENFKKDTNLVEVKESLDNYIQRFKSKKKQIDNNRDNKMKMISKNRSVKNIRVIRNKEASITSFRIKEIENEKNNFIINKENININNNYWQEQRNYHYNNMNETDKEKNDENNITINIDQNLKNMSFQNLENMISQKDLNDVKKNNEPKYKIKKKNINFIEENKNESIYNISINKSNKELYNNFNNSLSYNPSFKKSLIRKKYGKKNNINKIFEDCKMHIKNTGNSIRGNKTPIITKKFIEDYKINDNISLLKYSQSQSYLIKKNKKKTGKQIKVNKKKNSSNKKKIEKSKKILPSIMEEEEKIKNEIKNNLNVINGIENLNNYIKLKNKNLLKEIFKLFVEYYNQMKTVSYSTVITNISQNTGLKYIRKIIPINNNHRFIRDNSSRMNKDYSKTNFVKKNYFDIEKKKLIILKRKELGFIERYENCIDFIDNLRKDLIKYIFSERMKKNKTIKE